MPMEAEIAALASSGATTLVGLMVSDSWAQAKARVVKLFGHRSAEQAEAISAELGLAQVELMSAAGRADESTAADLEAEWRSRFRRLLASDPQAVADLKQLLKELSPEGDQGRTSIHEIKMSAKATGEGRVYQVGSGDMHIGDA
jgi:uncharacterized protein involved in exopolysaccharide biosynthesis